MDCIQVFESNLNEAELKVFRGLDSPGAIQDFIDSVPYRPEDENYCALNVLRDGKAHCFDGGLFAALALRRLGYPPRIVNMFPEAGTDDDHILALYQVDGFFGAVAKSNFPGLCRREAVYRSLRELVMSYFDHYFNADGVRTLRAYTSPLNLARFDHLDWAASNQHIDLIVRSLNRRRRYPVIPQDAAGRLSRLDRRAYELSMQSVDVKGLYKGAH